jgi:hypothetical protein
VKWKKTVFAENGSLFQDGHEPVLKSEDFASWVIPSLAVRRAGRIHAVTFNFLDEAL